MSLSCRGTCWKRKIHEQLWLVQGAGDKTRSWSGSWESFRKEETGPGSSRENFEGGLVFAASCVSVYVNRRTNSRSEARQVKDGSLCSVTGLPTLNLLPSLWTYLASPRGRRVFANFETGELWGHPADQGKYYIASICRISARGGTAIEMSPTSTSFFTVFPIM